ncbi:MAG: hypothetical protein WBX25_13645 [Rhodomicrobium sp.]
MSDEALHKIADLTLERVRRLETKLEQVNDKIDTLATKMDAAIDMMAATRADISALHTLVLGDKYPA